MQDIKRDNSNQAFVDLTRFFRRVNIQILFAPLCIETVFLQNHCQVYKALHTKIGVL